MDQESSLEDYLHRQIPLSAAMAVSVKAATTLFVILSAPLEPNINHKSTVFGGSASALGILAAWSLLHLRLVDAGLHSEIVIQSSQMDYDRPIDGSFTARSALSDSADWPTFLKTLSRKGRARIEVQSVLSQGDVPAGRLSGRFVAFLRDTS
ncbi:MAG TPA: YiiD C-terminal domain-containing protein [Sphingobium sp.]|uniref:YiiD C-terminal domain-containing protein n=1 Tax=Sphingobium sp. TaxID=1912891 RepID=UPI002ED42722